MMEMQFITGGTFTMGSPENEKDRFDNEGPQHQVSINPFYMGTTEVTNAQFRAFRSDHDSKDYEGHSLNGDYQPVVNISWEDAKAFCEWLSNETGDEYRLPTEAEWEYACRAGTETRRWWGDDLNDNQACSFANVRDLSVKEKFEKFGWSEVFNCNDGYAVTSPVGSFKPNKYGLYDMLGNVWEWCEDGYDEDYYSTSPDTNPTNIQSNQFRVLRGGGWLSDRRLVRSANRGGGPPGNRGYLIGFRVARTS